MEALITVVYTLCSQQNKARGCFA